MPSTAKTFFSMMVEPTVAEFMQFPFDIRRGLLAALILNHMADHVALDGCTSTDRSHMNDLLKTTRDTMLTNCPEFQFIQDVADATKHSKLSTSKKVGSVPREVSSSSQISSTPGIFQAPFGEGVFAEAAIVFINLKDGSSKPLLPAVQTVLAAWKSELGK